MLTYAPPAKIKIRPLLRLAPAMFLLPLSFDFKGAEAGGNPWQFLIIGISLLGAVLFFCTTTLPRSKGRLWRLCHWAILTTLLGSFLSLAINGTDLGNYARVIIAYVLFAAAFFLGAAMTHRGNTATVNGMVDFGCAVSVVFTVVAGLFISGSSLGEIRYQILSTVLLIYEAILLHRILIAKVRIRRNIYILTGCMALQLLSVTRSTVLGLFILVVIALWISEHSISRMATRTFRLSLWSAPFIALVVFVSAIVSPDLLERWGNRMFTMDANAFDPTTLSRLAELREQLVRWSSGPRSILIGEGYGASYGWSKDLQDALLDTGAFQLERLEASSFVMGHNYWASSLFAGGLLFGISLPIVLMYATISGLRTARRMLKLQIDHEMRMEVSRAAMILVATMAIAIGGNPFGGRYAPVMAGVALGALVVLRRQVKQQEMEVERLYRPRRRKFNSSAKPR